LASEIFEIERLKTGSKQGALSQAMVSKTKNDVIFVSNEPTLTTIGRVAGVIATPQMGDISYPVINDFNSYDFTDGCVFYDRNFLYTAVPQHGLIRIYNQTDASRHYWEAPVTYPISRFSIIDGEIYGHSYNTPETYKLFDGYNFNGQPIPANAVFSYQNFGSRSQTKGFNEVYLEGYINENTTLTLNIRKEMDGCSSDYSSTIDGSDRQFVCVGGSSAPLGKDPLGFNPLGGDLSVQTGLPPKFRKIFTMTVTPYFYEVQFGLSNSGVDQRWEIIGFGPLLIQASDLNNSIKS
jgi:hypothetical protein